MEIRIHVTKQIKITTKRSDGNLRTESTHPQFVTLFCQSISPCIIMLCIKGKKGDLQKFEPYTE